MKQLLLLFHFSLIALASFAQTDCNDHQPDENPWYINDQFGNDAYSTVFIPIGVDFIDVTYCIDPLAVPESAYCRRKGSVPVSWDGCGYNGRNLSAAGSTNNCITVRWTRGSCDKDYKGWVGLDLYNLCRRATLNVTVRSLCNPSGSGDGFKDCSLTACQTNNCVRITNSGTKSCCATLSIFTFPASSNTFGPILIPSAGATPNNYFEKCLPGVKIIGFSWSAVDCPRSKNIDPTNTDTNAIPNLIKVSKQIYGVYPSPANDKLNVEFPSHFEGETSVMVYDISGKLVFQKIFVDNTVTEISTKDWLGGIYLVKSSNKQGQLSQKIMIQH